MAILHELAHAYHDQVLGIKEPRILAAWKKFRESKRYESVLMNIGEKPVASTHGLLTTVAFDFNNMKPNYALEGSIAVAGSSIKFLQNNLEFIE